MRVLAALSGGVDSAVAFHMASTWLGMVIIEFAWSMFQAVLVPLISFKKEFTLKIGFV